MLREMRVLSTADPGLPGQVTHQFDEVFRFGMLVIAAGNRDRNDTNTLLHDPIATLVSLATGPLPEDSAPCYNRPSRGWRTCQKSAPSCAWATL